MAGISDQVVQTSIGVSKIANCFMEAITADRESASKPTHPWYSRHERKMAYPKYKIASCLTGYRCPPLALLQFWRHVSDVLITCYAKRNCQWPYRGELPLPDHGRKIASLALRVAALQVSPKRAGSLPETIAKETTPTKRKRHSGRSSQLTAARSVLRAGFDFELTRQISCFLDGHYPVQQTSEEVTGLAIPENMEGTPSAEDNVLQSLH
ncbi:hypothetical protein AK812_SmicGene33506 [Symbiodinium microadriaticum]|uniref:Uncharacterized protein n=1 Tax=Symbiodinium microadriaticum TaxID=2951 RepID=A0A1Q9CRC5_SYMMI|nr:hypothetical protein AK812_SmicGene33506 [Symbiodinium microadriaticum]